MLIEVLQETVNKEPEKTALICGESRITYQALYDQVGQLSQGLKELGIVEKDTVIVALPNSPEFVISFYAIAAIHAILLPLNPFLTEMEMARYLDEHPQTTAIITDAIWLDAWRQAVSQTGRTMTLIVINCPTELSEQADVINFQTLTGLATTPVPSGNYAGDFLIQYSSGSTGIPRQLYRTQANLFHQAKNCTQTIGITAADSILAVVPMYHAYGIGECLLAATSTGATLVILEQAVEEDHARPKPFIFLCQQMLELIVRYQITILPLVPYMVSVLAAVSEDTSLSLSSVRWCFSAGTFLTEEVFEQFRQRWNIPVRQLYGCTEAGAVAVNLEDESELVYNAIGQPMQHVELEIMDDMGQAVPDGTIGELVIKSKTLAAENVHGLNVKTKHRTVQYHGQSNGHRNNKLNMQQMSQSSPESPIDGYFFTGDLAQRDEKGRIYITGRKNQRHQHKSGPLEQDPALSLVLSTA